MESAISNFPVNEDTKKEIDRVRKGKEFKMIIFDAILSELKKETKTELEERASLNKAQALAHLIK